MPNDSLKVYVKEQIAKDVDSAQLSKTLLEKGWSQFDVDAAINEAELQSKKNVTGLDPSIEKQVVIDKNVKPKKPFFKWLFIIFLLLGLSASGYFGYFEVYLAPERVFSRSMIKMNEVNRVDYEGMVGIKVRGDVFGDTSPLSGLGSMFNLTSLNYIAEFSGSSDFQDPENVKSKITTQVTANNVNAVKFEVIGVKDDIYFKLHDLIDLTGFGFGSLDLFKNKWIRLNYEEIASDYGVENLTLEDSVDTLEMQELEEFIILNNPVTIKDELEDEVLDGSDSYHYSYDIDKDKLKEIIVKVSEIVDSMDLGEDEKADLDRMVDGLQFFGGEIWIDKKELYLRKIKINVDIESEEMKDIDITLSALLKMKNFNGNIVVEKPTEFVEAKDLYTQFLESISFPEYPQDVELIEEDGTQTPALEGLSEPDENEGEQLPFISDQLLKLKTPMMLPV